MPIANVRVPAGCYDVSAIRKIVGDLTDAIAEAEQIPDDPARRARIVVVWTELPSGSMYANGIDITDVAAPILIDLQPPAGAVTEDHAERLVEDVERVFAEHPPADGRPVMTSVILHHVGDGDWGIGGRIQHLADFARTAGYRHLRHLIA